MTLGYLVTALQEKNNLINAIGFIQVNNLFLRYITTLL